MQKGFKCYKKPMIKKGSYKMRWGIASIILCFLMLFQGLEAGRKAPTGNEDVFYKNYAVVDIAQTDMSWEELSRFNLPISYAPRIHSSGDIIYNTRCGGALWSSTLEVRRLPFDAKFAHFHAIAKNGTILASVVEDNGSPSWYLWPSTNCRKMNAIGIGCHCDDGGRVFYRDLNDAGMVVGTLEKDCGNCLGYYGVMRCPDGPLNILYPGVAWTISDKGYVYANDSSSCWNKPYLWHPKGGFLILADTCKKPPGNVKYSNGLFAFDGTVYGSYYCASNPEHHSIFHWEPCYENFETVTKGGFRIAAMNSAGTFVGSLNGRAIIQMQGEYPRDLNALIQNPGGDFFLIEATDINDIGQMVGYGIYKGKTHIFLIEPARKAQKILISR
ncbi:MAG: hypothetical protein WC222_03505 [Parachlamydiales bacterium]|jgi:hypothetical protein